MPPGNREIQFAGIAGKTPLNFMGMQPAVVANRNRGNLAVILHPGIGPAAALQYGVSPRKTSRDPLAKSRKSR
jgi:hypothetical protein